MRISHRELEAALRNPSQWRNAQAGPPPKFGGPGYDEIVRLGILHYHKTEDDGAALRYVERTLARHASRLKSQARKDDVVDRLVAYIEWAKNHHLDVVEARVNIAFPTGTGIELRGRVSRVDLVQGGYRGVLLGTFDSGWKTELRFPLLQMSLAFHYAIPVEDTFVGVQNLDGTGLEQCQFDQAERDDAHRRLVALAHQLGVAR